MRKLSFTLLMFLISISSFGQLYVKNTGNVGVNMSSPTNTTLGMRNTRTRYGMQINETISDSRDYVGGRILAGRSVTTSKPEGNVLINGADVIIRGGNVELHPGTTIINSNVVINPDVNGSGQ